MKKITLVLLFGLFALLASAQPGRFRPEMISDEEMIQMQTRDIVYWLGLDGKTKDSFVRDYTAFKKEIGAVAKAIVPPKSDRTEQEIDKALQNNFEVSEKILQIRKKYYLIFKEYMKPSQIQMMYHIENESGRRMHGGPGGPGGPGEPGKPGGLRDGCEAPAAPPRPFAG